MRTYTYRAASSESSCELCFRDFEDLATCWDGRLRACPGCESPVRIVILGKSQTVIKEKHRAGFTDYREDLALHPGDKEAFVNSPQQADRLVEKRKRQGWRVRDEDWGDMGSMIPDAPLDKATPTLTKNESEAMFKRCLDKGLAADH